MPKKKSQDWILPYKKGRKFKYSKHWEYYKAKSDAENHRNWTFESRLKSFQRIKIYINKLRVRKQKLIERNL